MSKLNKFYALLGSAEIDNNYDELKLLIEADRSVLQSPDSCGQLPIHLACHNSHVTLRVVQLLLNGWPESISQSDRFGDLPIHYLCANVALDETVSVDILTLLLEASPESIQREDSVGGLPIHTAAGVGMSPKNLKILVNAYPRSVRIPNASGALPIHLACETFNCRLDSVKYLLDIYPESISIESLRFDWLLIHHAASSLGLQKADIIKYLLSKDATCASEGRFGEYSLHIACSRGINLSAVKCLFDAYPEAIYEINSSHKSPLECAREYSPNADLNDVSGQQGLVVAFLETQHAYTSISHDTMAVGDESGRLPLHNGLYNNVSLGTIKILVKGSPSSVQVADYKLSFPLHIACEFSTIEVVKYLLEHNESCLNHIDKDGNSPLHYACRGGNCEVVKYLLEKQNPLISEHNADKKLPIHLLCESETSSDNLEHTDTIHRLLLAYPEAVKEYM